MKGPKRFLKQHQKKIGRPISIHSTDPFYHLVQNLYLIKVPEGTPASEKDIEDLFQPSTLETPLDGKLFDKKKEHGDHTSYGKIVFAEKVIRQKAATINFEGFDALISRIVSCIFDYKTKYSGAQTESILSPILAADSSGV